MEFTREIYWNIGHGAGTLVPMYLLTMAAMAVLVWGFWLRVKVYRLGKPLQRTDNLAGRLFDPANRACPHLMDPLCLVAGLR